MAAPNIVNVTSIIGKTAYDSLVSTGQSATLTNSASSNKVFKINETGFFDLIVDDGSHNLKDIFLSLKYLFKFLKKNGTYIIEEYKHPNYYNYNRNIEHIFVDEFLKNLKNKKFSVSSILDKNDQKYLIESISGINIYKGNLKDSDICFIKKKN